MKQISLPTEIFGRTRTLLLAIIFLIIFLFLSISPSHALDCNPDGPLQTTDDPPLTDKEAIRKINLCAIESNIFDDKIFNFNQIAGTVDSIHGLLTGTSRLHPETNHVTAGTGALAASGTIVAALYSVEPISGVEYFAQQLEYINPVKPVYAQEGIGYAALQPVQKLWSIMRNITYVGFVIVFVIMGFMIMFRAKISPQAVATIQDSIPRITVALVLVTFSYAIAGFMIDIMFVLLNVILSTLESQGAVGDTSAIFKESVFGIVFGSWRGIVGSVGDGIANVIDEVVDITLLDKILGFFGGGIAAIIAGIAILYVMFKVFLQLLMAYVNIIILTIVAPFFFLSQALPGVNGASAWFKQMAASIAVFPAVAIMFVFAGILSGIGHLGGSTETQLGGDAIGQFPLLAGDIGIDALSNLIGFGILLMTPTVADMIKKAIGSPGQGMGAGIGASLAPAAGVVGGAMGKGARAGGSTAFNNIPYSDKSKGRFLSGKYWKQKRADQEAGERMDAEKYQNRGQVGGFTTKRTR